jgi:signal transduction histidine kinase
MSEPATPPRAPSSRFPRAEFILATAIALVSVLVLALVFTIRAENPARARTLQTIAVARTVRDETLALSQAMAAAESGRADLLAGAADWIPRRRAQFEAHASVSRLRATASGDPELLALVQTISAIVERDFVSDDNAIRNAAPSPSGPHAASTQLPLAIDVLILAVNARNDAARQAENRVRERLDNIGIALGFLSLVASALSIFALRRERRQWCIANAMAEGARARAAASDMAKTRFLAAASHDMRQPLHALTLYLSALGRRVHESEARGILSNAERAAQSLVSMFGVLLDLARIEANVVKPEFEDVAVQDVFERIVAEHPGADIATEPSPLSVRSDPVLLERIVRNLVSNALKHGDGHVRLAAKESGGEISLSVSDDGPGIAPEDQGRIFDEFVRLEGGSAAEGLGLGLSIVQRLAALMGHRVDLRSALGQGATFVVRAKRAANANLTHQHAQETPSLAGKTVVVLDDDTLARGAMVGAVSDLGASVRACASQYELNDALTQVRPDFVMLDLRLNDKIVGIDIARELSSRLPDARIVIVTGDTAADTLSKLRASGHRWLIKPVDPHDLAAALAG